MIVEMQKPRVSAALSAAVAEIEEAGVKPTPDEVVWLNSLIEKTILPGAGNPPTATRFPFKVGRVWFHPLTMAAYIWFNERAREWWTDDAKLTEALAYAMAHSDGVGNVFPEIMESKAFARLRVKAWAIVNLTFTRRTVAWAIGQFYGDHETVKIDGTGIIKNRDEEDSVFEWGELIAFIAATYGMDPERIQRMGMNELLGMAKNAPSPHGKSTPDKDPEKIRAQGNLRLAIRHIIATHKAQEHVA
jgi:hypothetical protein